MVVGRGRFARTLSDHLRSRITRKDAHLINVSHARSDEVHAPVVPGGSTTGQGADSIEVPTLLGPEGREHLRRLFGEWEPSIAVAATSKYSPYAGEASNRPPFAATLPRQLPVAWNVSQVALRLERPPVLLNACYPEMVNPVLHALGAPFHAGLGNAQALNRGQRFGGRGSRQALAHHSHLGQAFVNNPLMFDLEQRRLSEPTGDDLHKLSQRRSLGRATRNDLAAAAAAELVVELATEGHVTACLPGVQLETGAVPVSIDLNGRDLTVRLSDDQLDLVRARHQQECHAEGWQIDEGGLSFSQEAFTAMSPAAPGPRRMQAEQLAEWLLSVREAA